MVDLLGQGAAWLTGRLNAHAGRAITYARGAASVELTATVGRTEFEQVDEYGVVHRTESRDFLVSAEDLILNAVEVLPAAGDVITEDDGTKTYTYEVMAPGGEPPWRHSDPQRVRLRIHSKHVGTALS